MSSAIIGFVIGYLLIGAAVASVQWRFESLLARHTGKTWAGNPNFEGNCAVLMIWPLYLLVIFFGDSTLEESTYAQKKVVRPPEPWCLSVNPYKNLNVRVSLDKKGALAEPLIIGDASIDDDDFDEKLAKLRQKGEARASTLNALE